MKNYSIKLVTHQRIVCTILCALIKIILNQLLRPCIYIVRITSPQCCALRIRAGSIGTRISVECHSSWKQIRHEWYEYEWKPDKIWKIFYFTNYWSTL